MVGSISMTSIMCAQTWNPVVPQSLFKQSRSHPVVPPSSHCAAHQFFQCPLSTILLHSKHHHITPTTSSSVVIKASSSSSSPSEYVEEPATKVRFQTSLSLPGCSTALSLLGTGYREKVFAIIGVKVYAAGLYINQSVLSTLSAWRGQSAAQIQDNPAIFSSIYQAPTEKALTIVLVRDVDGKTFWDALNEAISPRLKSPSPVDESALSTFRGIFQGRPLKKKTSIILTWLGPSSMQVCVSSEGIPSAVDATIESTNVTFALFDVFLGDAPVSPSLKVSVSGGLATYLQ
ncbi:Fatty-acid-binding protein 3, chloroplastic [Turnera subulata]|uniref:Chalcone-flavonone isomerase family protein n=1 Tax=Turnera subulata TaxID=218843 RepID=A0A9Q0G2K6_9ROSI|nr:Fatty-acid-binding protein 3, chloroplastic [Turnera subulata]